jgi:hypothetical protein
MQTVPYPDKQHLATQVIFFSLLLLYNSQNFKSVLATVASLPPLVVPSEVLFNLTEDFFFFSLSNLFFSRSSVFVSTLLKYSVMMLF